MKIARSLRFLPLLGLSVFTAAFAPACGGTEASAPVEVDENDITNVPHTDVERQSIGNCWLYSEATWVESMHLTATGEAFDVSDSYWTYWHWFDQIVGGFFSKPEISTGGNYYTANNIIKKYGLMPEKDFIAEDVENEMSSRQKTALDAINLSLKSGALSDPNVRRDKVAVRAELDKAWQLTDDKRAMLDSVFGPSVTRTFQSPSNKAQNADTPIVDPATFDVSYTEGPGKAPRTAKLTDAMRSWQQVSYSTFDGRSFLQRVQRAMHDSQPVIITWFVDFNALENNKDSEYAGSFNLQTLENNGGPGRQGGHMTVLEDYEATLADGTVLKAGETLDPKDPEDKALLDKAVAKTTQIKFLRVKNSWGNARPDRAFAPGMPGYHDLYMEYLNGPLKRCGTKPDGSTDTENCNSNVTPLQNVVLPPGY